MVPVAWYAGCVQRLSAAYHEESSSRACRLSATCGGLPRTASHLAVDRHRRLEPHSGGRPAQGRPCHRTACHIEAVGTVHVQDSVPDSGGCSVPNTRLLVAEDPCRSRRNLRQVDPRPGPARWQRQRDRNGEFGRKVTTGGAVVCEYDHRPASPVVHSLIKQE